MTTCLRFTGELISNARNRARSLCLHLDSRPIKILAECGQKL